MPLSLPAPEGVHEIARRLADAGFEAWAVGGAVRDALLELPAMDWDLATDARPPQVRKLFRRTVPIGIEHGTVGVIARDGVMYEVTTFRRDVETFGRHAVVEFADALDDDLGRRDFTINAIAWDPIGGRLHDPFAGERDLREHRLRTVGRPAQRFAEDYLRVLRALRFAGHFDLRIEDETWAALRDAVDHLHVLSAERVREELWKVLGGTRRASITLDLYRAAGVLEALFPELHELVGLRLAPDAEDDAWARTLRVIDAIAPARPMLRMAGLLHAVGYPAARTRDLRGGWRFTGHEQMGARRAEEVMRRLKASHAQTERVSTLIATQSMLFPPDAPDSGVRRWLAYVTPERVRDLFRLRIAMWRADRTPGGDRDVVQRWRHAHRVLLAHPAITLGQLAVGGDDLRELGLEPGPRFGEILRALLNLVLERPEMNTRERLLETLREHYGVG